MNKSLAFAAACLVALPASAQLAPYAGQQQRPIKALSSEEVAGLLAGEGMGLAKAAELNGFPGPAHVLEHADALELTPQQRVLTRTLFDTHKASARRLGEAVVEAERALDHAFQAGRIDPAMLSRLTADIGIRQARLREEHLRTHLEQAALLRKEQVERYAQLRGYRETGHSAPAGQEHGRHGGHR